MANKYHTKLRNKASAKIFKIAGGVLNRNKASKELFKKVNKPKKRFNRGGKV